ncbi:MAG: hypothetical protein OFPI_18670 [Osedax symbiont Rs2]|nr:MAG: hypothetical protein OFPI_18670 [Osedax symbiont Rs2]
MKTVIFITFMLFADSALAAAEPAYNHRKVQLVMLEKAKSVVVLASNMVIIEAVRAHNQLKIPMALIKQRDRQWIASSTDSAFKLSLQRNRAGALLKSTVLRNRAIYSEAFLVDNRGANVGAYPATSDYWQGDEEKFTIAFNAGRGQLLITPVSFDQSTFTFAAQIAAPVVNDQGITIGVLFIGIKLSYAQIR